MGVSSLAALGELGDTKTIVEMVGTVAGIHSSGWAAHHRGPIKNGAPLLHASEALVSHSFRQQWSAAVDAAAAAGPDAPAAPVPAIPFKERLAAAGYAAIHPSARPT